MAFKGTTAISSADVLVTYLLEGLETIGPMDIDSVRKSIHPNFRDVTDTEVLRMIRLYQQTQLACDQSRELIYDILERFRVQPTINIKLGNFYDTLWDEIFAGYVNWENIMMAIVVARTLVVNAYDSDEYKRVITIVREMIFFFEDSLLDLMIQDCKGWEILPANAKISVFQPRKKEPIKILASPPLAALPHTAYTKQEFDNVVSTNYDLMLEKLPKYQLDQSYSPPKTDFQFFPTPMKSTFSSPSIPKKMQQVNTSSSFGSPVTTAVRAPTPIPTPFRQNQPQKMNFPPISTPTTFSMPSRPHQSPRMKRPFSPSVHASTGPRTPMQTTFANPPRPNQTKSVNYSSISPEEKIPSWFPYSNPPRPKQAEPVNLPPSASDSVSSEEKVPSWFPFSNATGRDQAQLQQLASDSVSSEEKVPSWFPFSNATGRDQARVQQRSNGSPFSSTSSVCPPTAPYTAPTYTGRSSGQTSTQSRSRSSPPSVNRSMRPASPFTQQQYFPDQGYSSISPRQESPDRQRRVYAASQLDALRSQRRPM